jgi:hypothetical protein
MDITTALSRGLPAVGGTPAGDRDRRRDVADVSSTA